MKSDLIRQQGLFRGLAVALAVTASACASAPEVRELHEKAASLERVIETSLDRVETMPGVAVAVYTEEGVYTAAFGYADIETREPVTEDTAYYIASSTKSVLSLAMSMLDLEGKIDLDAPLTELSPDAPFPAAVKAVGATPRMMLTHTSGIENDAIGWRAAYTGQHDPELNWRLLETTTVNDDAPKGNYDYTNEGYNILTVLTDRELDTPWQDLLQEMIFDPADMTRTSARMSDAVKGGWSVARPHATTSASGPTRLRLEKKDNTMQSAGGLIMSASDAALWLELMIEDGRIGRKQVVPAQAVINTRADPVETGQSPREYPRGAYSLGWYHSSYREEDLLFHFGGFTGFRTHISYMPERKIGVAVLANDVPVGALTADVIANGVYDVLLDVPTAGEDLNTALDQVLSTRARIIDSIAADVENRSGREWTLSRPHGDYTGTYVNDLFGTMQVSARGDEVEVTYGNLQAIGTAANAKEAIRVELIPMQGNNISFISEEDGPVTALRFLGDRYERVGD
ncbi:MAG: serine hydrolase domain-containing protein [Pseudomonadota bacterium]